MFVDEFIAQQAPGIAAHRLNEPFHLQSAVYDPGTDTITVTVGRGRADFGGGDVVEFAAAQTLEITPVAINTTYFVFLTSAGGLTYSSTSGVEGEGQAALGDVATGATKDDLTVTDRRGMLPVPPRRPLAALTGWIDNMTSAQAATQALRPFYLSTGLTTSRRPLVMDRAGSVVGISVSTLGARTAGTLTVEVYINGVATGLTAVIDGTNTQYSFGVQAAGLDTFAAGDRIDVYCTTSSFDSGVTERSYEAAVFVEFD